MATNPDFSELFAALSAEGAEFIVVGGYAVMFHSTPRFTKDIDVWVRPSPGNAARVRRALAAFGAPLGDLTVEDLAVEGTIFQIGVPPNRIDILTSIDGVTFDIAYPRSVPTTYADVPIRVLGFEDLIANKRTVGRKQDELDVENLERRAKRR
ncbi:MAG TPA: nucleotidyl transferase AbiEii/AbiGii toxin family protein [Polyangiaceae bacterium]|jgi:hypothetical protein